MAMISDPTLLYSIERKYPKDVVQQIINEYRAHAKTFLNEKKENLEVEMNNLRSLGIPLQERLQQTHAEIIEEKQQQINRSWVVRPYAEWINDDVFANMSTYGFAEAVAMEIRLGTCYRIVV